MFCPHYYRKSFEERSEGKSGILGDDVSIRMTWQLQILVAGELARAFEVRMIFVCPATEKVVRKNLKATVVY